MELASLQELKVDDVVCLLREEGLAEEILKCFEEAEIDGSILLTMTRSDFSDMFRVLRVKRAAIDAWKTVTGLDFDDNGNPIAKKKQVRTSTPKRRIIDSDSEDCDEDYSFSIKQNHGSTSATVDKLHINEEHQTKRTSPTTKDSNSSGPQVSSCSPPGSTSLSSNESSPSSFKENWLKKYQLPNRFSCAVEAGLSAKFLSANLRNEMVRDICTSVLNHTTRPNKTEREEVAKMIVEKYPFLRDHQIHEDVKPWGSFEVKIMNRFKKLQRKKSVLDTSKDKSSTQGGRPIKKRKCCWTEVPASNETEEDMSDLIGVIKSEWKQTRKNHESIKSLMSRTYPRRREMVLVEMKMLPEILNIFPPISNMLYIKADFARIMGNDGLAKEMKDKFKDVWTEKIINYAKKQSKYKKTIEEITNAVDSGCAEQECKERTALRLASVMLRPPNKKGKQTKEHEDAIIKVVLSEESLDASVQATKQPVIMIPGSLYSSDIMYVVGEGVVVSEITTKKIADAIVILMSLYYMFNIDYKIGLHVFNFIEMALMNLTPRKCPVSVTTFINMVSSLEN